MGNKKIPFFIKLKTAIFNFDKYQGFAEEKLSWSIKYYLKLMAIFIIVISIVLIITFSGLLKRGKEIIANDVPDFNFKNNTLNIEGEEQEILKNDRNGYFCFILSSGKEDISQIENTGYQTVIAFLKNKVTLRNSDGLERSYSYENISQKYNLGGINKQSVLEFMNNKWIYVVVFAIGYVYFYFSYLVSIFVDILLLSLVGFLISRIINVRFKYSVIFKMSIYSLTLSILLYLIYIVVNTFTGFTVKYFEIAYNVIGYIYLITAMFMIKSDLIKQQMEVAKIVEEQKRIREESEDEEEKEEEKEDKEEKKKEEEKEENNKENDNPAPAEN